MKGSVFFVGKDPELLRNLLNTGLSISGFVPDLHQFFLLQGRGSAGVIIIQENAIAQFDFGQAISHVKEFAPGSKIILLSPYELCPDPESLGIEVCFRPPYEPARISNWINEQQAGLDPKPANLWSGCAKPVYHGEESLPRAEWYRIDTPAWGSPGTIPGGTVSGPSFTRRGQQTIMFLNSKGGVGRSFLSFQLARALCSTGLRVLLLDLHFSAGEMDLFLNLDNHSTIIDFLPFLQAGDDEPLKRFSLKVPSMGFDALPGPIKPELGELIEVSHVEAVVRWAQRQYQIVVIDTGPNCTDERVIAALASVDRVVIVLNPDLFSLKQARMAVDALQGRRVLVRNRLIVVVNKVAPGKSLAAEDVYRVLGLYPALGIPEVSGGSGYGAGLRSLFPSKDDTELSQAMARFAAIFNPGMPGIQGQGDRPEIGLVMRFWRNARRIPAKLKGQRLQ